MARNSGRLETARNNTVINTCFLLENYNDINYYKDSDEQKKLF